MLIELEKQYGKRDTSYSILGVQLSGNGPRTCRSLTSDNQLIIELSSKAKTYGHLIYQLAHESVHTLSPVKREEVSILEEGLATFFSKKYVCDFFMKECGWSEGNNTDYSNASELVTKLIEIDHLAIKKLREDQPVISYITSDQLLKYYLGLGEITAKKLEKKFHND